MLFIQLLFVYLVILWIYLLWRRRGFYRVMFQLPGPIGYPILGSLHKLWNNEGVNTLGNLMSTYGPSYLFWMGPTPMYVVSDPRLIQELLTVPNAINKSRLVFGVIQQLLGSAILTLDNPVWSKHRRVLNAAFGHNILLSFMTIFNDESSSLVQELDAFVGKGEKELLSRFQNFSFRTAIRK
ncbi:probable cytochrome P450 313a4 [Drosophila nasuta]|uniref:probable cytochrome P450 313a4 n=1 Tax=Drosophila nasuta TaxID=42062 RepID=UPI00295F5809|nr:probable cytochrome P450 313a4 [Drosophila nasuta]